MTLSVIPRMRHSRLGNDLVDTYVHRAQEVFEPQPSTAGYACFLSCIYFNSNLGIVNERLLIVQNTEKK